MRKNKSIKFQNFTKMLIGIQVMNGKLFVLGKKKQFYSFSSLNKPQVLGLLLYQVNPRTNVINKFTYLHENHE